MSARWSEKTLGVVARTVKAGAFGGGRLGSVPVGCLTGWVLAVDADVFVPVLARGALSNKTPGRDGAWSDVVLRAVGELGAV